MKNLINIDESARLSKRELQERGASDSQLIQDEGLVNAINMVAMARKAIEYLGAFAKGFDSAARAEVNTYGGEKETLGAVFSIGSTGDRIDYDQDPIYQDLKKALKDRETLLKVAKYAKESIYDGEGIEVPRLPLKSASREVLKVRL